MSYTSHFYAVDIAALQSEIARHDEALLEPVIASIRAAGEGEPAATGSLNVILTLDCEIEYANRIWRPEEFAHELRNPRYNGWGIVLFERKPNNADEGRRYGIARQRATWLRTAPLFRQIQDWCDQSGVRYTGIAACSDKTKSRVLPTTALRWSRPLARSSWPTSATTRMAANARMRSNTFVAYWEASSA